MIERKIIIGLVTNTAYIKEIREIWNPAWIESDAARTLGVWCIEHFDEFNVCVGTKIEDVYHEKLKEGRIDKDLAEELEEDILPDLSDEYVVNKLDLDYLISRTKSYFKERQLLLHSQKIQNVLEHSKKSPAERVLEAETISNNFKPLSFEKDTSIDLSDPEIGEHIRLAFESVSIPLIRFPRLLGKFWNNQFVRGALVGILAIAKRGKTFLLLYIMMLASRQNKKVAFFQAGDMNEAEQLKRISVYLCGRNNLEQYCTEHYEPVRDCILNQMDQCTRPERECKFGCLEDFSETDIRGMDYDALVEQVKNFPDYKPCWNCDAWKIGHKAAPWLKKIEAVDPLLADDAIKAVEKMFVKKKRSFKISTHPSGTLSVKDIEVILDKWEASKENFVPDIIVIDYADILRADTKVEYRHQRNAIWASLRRLSQTARAGKLPLVIAPTQADADGYEKDSLGMGNFNEDRRINDHVTALYGLNQDVKGREKSLGLLRINEIIIREGAAEKEITILQNLRKGRPILGSMIQ